MVSIDGQDHHLTLDFLPLLNVEDVTDGNDDFIVGVVRPDNSVLDLMVSWLPGRSIARMWMSDNDEFDRELLGGPNLVLKIDPRTEGFRIRYRGADLDVKVRTPRAAELAKLMPEKLPPDTSKMLLCPMPGLVVSIAVEEGQEVQDGQTLATVEAMKMENVLRAEKSGVIRRINATAGASLMVDDVIMEFE